MIPQLQPLSFSQVQDLQSQVGLDMPVQDFARELNLLTQQNIASSAIGNPFEIGIKRASAAYDRFLDRHLGGVNDALGEAGAWLFGKFGADQDFGREVGEDMLRSTLDFVPAIAGFALSPLTSGASIPIGLGISAGLTGANTYEKTDSPLQAGLSAGLTFVGPKVTELGASTALRAAAKFPFLKKIGIEGGSTVVQKSGEEVFEALVAKRVGDRILGAVSGEAAINIASMMADAGVHAIENEGELINPFTKENILANLLDPTLVFGVKELVSPSVISTKAIEANDSNKQFSNADAETESSMARLDSVVPDLTGMTSFEIERAYRDLVNMAKSSSLKLSDTQRKEILDKLAEARQLARESVNDLTPGMAQTLFGESLHTVLDESFNQPVTKTEVDENGNAVETPMRLEDVLSPEELQDYNENLAEVLSPEAMLQLVELKTIDTPKNQDEYQNSVKHMNRVREELGMELLDDTWLQNQVAKALIEDESVEVAVERAWQAAKNETEDLVQQKRKEVAEQRIADRRARFTQIDLEKAESIADWMVTEGVYDPTIAERAAAQWDIPLEQAQEFARVLSQGNKKGVAKRLEALRKGRFNKDLGIGKVEPAGDSVAATETTAKQPKKASSKKKKTAKETPAVEVPDVDAPVTTTDPDIVDALEAFREMRKRSMGEEPKAKKKVKQPRRPAPRMKPGTRTAYPETTVVPDVEDLPEVPKDRPVPNSAEDILRRLEEKKTTFKKPKGSRRNPILDAVVEEEEPKTRKRESLLDDDEMDYPDDLFGGDDAFGLIDDDEIEFFGSLDSDEFRNNLIVRIDYRLRNAEEAVANKLRELRADLVQGNTKRAVDMLRRVFQRQVDVFRVEQRQTREELFQNILKKKGVMSNDAIAEAMPVFGRLIDMFDASDARLFEIMDDSVYGAATISGEARKLMLGGKGLEKLNDKDKVRALSFVTAHELGHLAEQLYNNGTLSQRHFDQFTRFREWVDDASLDDRQLALEIMRDTFLPKGFRNSEVVDVALKTVDDGKEVRANLISMWAMGQTMKPDVVGLNLMPRPVVKGLQMLQDLYKAFVGSMRGLGQFDVLFNQRRDLRRELDEMSNMLKTWNKSMKESDVFHAESRKILGMGTNSRTEVLEFFGGKRKDKYDPESALPYDNRGVLRQWFDKWIMPMEQLMQQVPQFRGIAADLHNYNGDTRAALNRIVSHITGEMGANGKVQFHSRTEKQQWEIVKDSNAASAVMNKWMLEQQTQDKPIPFAELKTEAPEVYESLMKLKDREREAVVNVFNRMGAAMKQLHKEVLDMMDRQGQALLTSYIAHKKPELHADAPGLANYLANGVRLMRSSDPLNQQKAQQQLAVASTKLGPELFQRVFDLTTDHLAAQDEMMVKFSENQHFFSEMRFGEYILHWEDPSTDPNKKNKSGALAFDTYEAGRAKEKELRKRGIKATLEKTRRGVPAVLGQDRLLQRMEEIDERGRSLVDSMVDLDPEVRERIKQEFNSRADFVRDIQAAKLANPDTQRHLSEGRESLDMVQTQVLYFQAAVRAMQKKLFYHRLNYRYAHPTMKDPLVLSRKESMDRHIKNFFTPDTELGRAITTFSAGYYLGGNLSSHIVELLQPGFSFVPEAVFRGLSFVEANKLAIKAMQEVGMFTLKHLPGKIGRGTAKLFGINQPAMKDNNRFWKNTEYGKLMDYATERGAISLGHASEVLDTDIEANTDLTGVLGDRRGDTPNWKRYGMTPALDLAKLGLKFYQQFTEFNARVSLIMGYEIAKKQGAKGQKLLEDALMFSRVVSFSGGKLNRPEAMFANEGTWRTVGQAMYSLQGYTFGMLGAMRRYAETAYSKEQFPNITESERKNARKALKAMVGAQFLGAGVMGLPFVEAAMHALYTLTGIDLEKEVREGLADLFQEDEEKDAGILSNAIMHGAANSLAGYVLPGAPDIGSRFAIGGVMGINSYDGFSFSEIFGPTTSFLENVVKGATGLVKGDPRQAFVDIAPPAAKKIFDLYRNDWELRGRNGEKLIDSTYGERLAYAIGFNPQRISRMRTRESIEYRTQERMRELDVRRFDKLAELYMENPYAAREQLEALAYEDPHVDIARKHGDPERYRLELEASKRRAVDKLFTRVEKKLFPKENRPTGTLNTTYGRKVAGSASEVQRLQLKTQIEQTLGLRPSLSQRAMRRAVIIDRIQQQNPGMGRPEAAAIADQVLARGR